ncbi:MAG: hypothetical protein IJS38_00830 [Erysipelotrichaceae bacterium]|nr:hypothetical protein [Erysipelotrichaceae bacterium]
MNRKSFFITLLAALLVLGGCGSSNNTNNTPAEPVTPVEPSEPSEPVEPPKPQEPDISNLNAVMYDADDLKVVLLGAEYVKDRMEYQLKLHFEKKTEGKLTLFLKNLSLSGTSIFMPYDTLGLYNARYESPVELTESTDDTISFMLAEERQAEMGQPGLIEAILHYAVNGTNYNTVKIAAEAGISKLPAWQPVTVSQFDTKWYQNLNEMSNPNDFGVTVTMQLKPRLDGHYVPDFSGKYVDSGYSWDIDLGPHAEKVIVGPVDYFVTKLVTEAGKSVTCAKLNGFTGFDTEVLMVQKSLYSNAMLDLKDVSWKITKQPASGKRGKVTVEVSWPEENKKLSFYYSAIGFKNGVPVSRTDNMARLEHGSQETFSFENDSFYKCDSWELYCYNCVGR